MSQLALSLLGSFQARLDERPITGFRSHKTRCLLTYLAVEAGRPHARAALAALLWPDTPGSTALNYLRSALANLRELLGDEAAAKTGHPPCFLVTRETLQLNPAADVRLDIAALTTLAGNPLDQGALEGALALYRGPFLEGFAGDDGPAFAEWLLITREHYSRMALAVLQQLAALAFDQHRYIIAVEYCRRWLALEPWDEAAHRQLMAALALDGNRNAALAHYAACRNLLAQELGVEPSPPTTALYWRIRSGAIAPARTVDTVQLADATPSVPLTTIPRFCAPGQEDLSHFVAREAELARLDQQLDLMLAGAGQVIFVQGDAGSGKTALLHAFGRRAARRHAGIALAEGRCSDCAGYGDFCLPFREIARLLASREEAAGPSRGGLNNWPHLVDGAYAGTVAGDGEAAASPAGSAAQAQSDFFEQVTLFLQEIAQQRPLLLLLDDLQWADRGTISLLFHLGRYLSGSRILLVGAYRPEDVAQRQDRQRRPLTLVVHEMQRNSGVPPIDLNQVDGCAFVDALLDGEPNCLGEAFRATLYQHTEGHALFTVELLRAMKERGDLVQNTNGAWVAWAEPNWQSLPPRVEAVIAERIERLPRRLRSLLDAASVEGDVFSLQMLAEQTHLQPAQLAWWLGELLCRQHGLICVDARSPIATENIAALGQPPTRYRFAHSLYRAYLYGQMDAVRRACLHRDAAEALERLHAPAAEEVAVPLAWHFEQAGELANAVHYRRLAGDRAMLSSTCEAAIGHYLRALTLLASLPITPERMAQEVALHLALAEPLTMMRGWGGSEVRAAIQHAYDLCRSTDDHSRLVETMRTLATTYVGRGELAKALALGEALMQMAQEDKEPRTLVAAHFSLGEAHFFRGELELARKHLEQIMALLDLELPQPAVVTGVDIAVAALNWLGMSLWALGCPQQAAACCGRALARAYHLQQPFTLAFALLVPGALFALQRGDLVAAEDNAAAALRICVEYDVVFYRGMVDIVQGYLTMMRGAPAAGLAQMQQGLAAWEAPGTKGAAVYYRMLLAAACRATGQCGAGLAAVNDAVALVENTGLFYSEAELWRIKGELLQDAAEPAAAEACLQQAIAVARRRQAHLWELRAIVSLTRLWQMQGRGAEAVPLLSSIYATFDESHDLPDLQAAATLLAAVSQAAPANAAAVP
jgi:DNA-binding SARP family transcriptional activator/tetratricopeptide (TPR) repeat protein